MIDPQPPSIEIVEVGLRDGFQSVAGFIPTEQKIALLRKLYDAGLRRMEVTSFVGAAVVPQLADAAEVLAAANDLDGLDAHVLVPTLRHAQRALDAGARHVGFVLSVSEWHNRANVRRERAESAGDFAKIASLCAADVRLRLILATAFDCPKLGRIAPSAVFELLDGLIADGFATEVVLCDTTGRADPLQVGRSFIAARRRYPSIARWAFHGHDTYGLGAANAFAAWQAGATAIDASFAGLGGCPFAPGATGNVATEDVVWMFERMGVSTRVDLPKLLSVAVAATAIPGANVGGRVRNVLGAAARTPEPEN